MLNFHIILFLKYINIFNKNIFNQISKHIYL